MNALNLLPDEHLQQQSRSLDRRRRLRWSLVGGVIACLWLVGLGMQVMHRQTLIREAQRELAQWQVKAAEHKQWVGQRDALQKKLALVQQLRDPIAPAAMLALLTQMFPVQAALQSLVIQVPPPALPKALLPGSPQAVQKKGVAPTPVEQSPMLVQLEGLVEDGFTPARLAGDLARSKVLAQVRIEQSQQVTLNKQLLHQFRLNIEIPLAGGQSSQPLQKVASR